MRRMWKSADSGFFSLELAGGLAAFSLVLSALVFAGDVRHQSEAALITRLERARNNYDVARGQIQQWRPIAEEYPLHD